MRPRLFYPLIILYLGFPIQYLPPTTTFYLSKLPDLLNLAAMPPKSKKGKSKTGPITQAGPRPRATPPHTLSAAYIFPGLHYKIITALSGDCVADSALPYFNLAGTDREATDTYDTTIQAAFQCINQSCSEFEWFVLFYSSPLPA